MTEADREEYEEKHIAFLDILGFKSNVSELSREIQLALPESQQYQ